jgi:hypothetical protein
VYYYSKTLKFPADKDGIAIFQMNTDIYRTGNAVDAMVGAMLFYSAYKVGSQFYILTLLGGWASFSITSTLFWSVMIAGQLNYLT